MKFRTAVNKIMKEWEANNPYADYSTLLEKRNDFIESIAVSLWFDSTDSERNVAILFAKEYAKEQSK